MRQSVRSEQQMKLVAGPRNQLYLLGLQIVLKAGPRNHLCSLTPAPVNRGGLRVSGALSRAPRQLARSIGRLNSRSARTKAHGERILPSD